MQPHFPFLCRGVFVKLRDHHRHPECYVCTDCGTNLKQKGHFFVEDQIYCEKHARERVTPPEGYDVVTVFPKWLRGPALSAALQPACCTWFSECSGFSFLTVLCLPSVSPAQWTVSSTCADSHQQCDACFYITGNGFVPCPLTSTTVPHLHLGSSLLQTDIGHIEMKPNVASLMLILFYLINLDFKAVCGLLVDPTCILYTISWSPGSLFWFWFLQAFSLDMKRCYERDVFLYIFEACSKHRWLMLIIFFAFLSLQ